MHVSYMGTKQKIAPHVAKIIADGPSGPLLDVFSGICAIGSAVSPTRQVWCNDVQFFASSVAKAFFTSPELPLSFDLAAEIVGPLYQDNRRLLSRRFSRKLTAELGAFSSREVSQVSSSQDEISRSVVGAKFRAERTALATTPQETPYRLFSITFAGGYLGLAQSIQVDSIRYALDQLRDRGRLTAHQHRWLCLALCQAISKVATTTGHFAQYMTVKEKTLRRFIAQRSRSVWSEWLAAIHEFSPLGTRMWRSRNRVFRQDAVKLLKRLSAEKLKPATVYADPPYTSDQYSRYYHVYETLLRYDYPNIEGVGRYRPDRFVSQFCLKTKVEEAIEGIVESSAALGARLILSYPGNGLLPDADTKIRAMIKHHYGQVGSIMRLQHSHSSLGASKGPQYYAVKELVFSTR